MQENSRVNMIREKLTSALSPDSIEIEDDSQRHAGHAGAAGGGGHFNVAIVSSAFEGKSPIQRHRLVYDAMCDAMNNEIHALSIKASTPEEAQA